MEIWNWIDGLDNDISDAMYDLSSAVCDAKHDRVDSLVPMIVGMARERGLPWVEVFARHWELQSVIFHRHDPGNGMPKAIALLERSHRDDAIDCPQTICVSQDVCAAYGMVDGPGYAKERIAVCEETLERISPAWPCWTCISEEKADAMIDESEPEAAIEFIEDTERLIVRAGVNPDTFDMIRTKIEALRKLGRYEEGLKLAREARSPHYRGDSFTFEFNALAVQMLARLGRCDEALEDLPAIDDVLDRGRADIHGETLAALVRDGAIAFDDERIRDFARLALRNIARGAFRTAADVALLAVELCADYGQPHAGLGFAELAAQAIEELRAKDVVTARLNAAVSRLPDAVDEAPDADRWRALGFLHKAAALAKAALEASPDDRELFRKLARLYLDTSAYEDLRPLLDDASDRAGLAADAMWYQSFLDERTQGRDAAIECLTELVAGNPDWRVANWRLAYLLDAAGELRSALAAYNSTVALFDESGSYDWERMVVAERLGEHDIVRDSATRLEIELENDTGPIEEDWGGCVVHYDDDTNVFAIRTGPVTARIEQLARYRVPERYKDEVVIMPTPENPDADENTYFVYPHIETIKTGNFRSYIIDGVHPGEEMLARIREKIEGAGFVFEQKSDEDYQLKDPEHGESVTGLFASIGVPEACEPIEVHTLLTEIIDKAGIEVMTWLDLLKELELAEDIAAQTIVAEAWGV